MKSLTMFLGKLTEEGWKHDAFGDRCVQGPNHAQQEAEKPVTELLITTTGKAVVCDG